MFKRKGPSEVEIARENEVKIGITQELSRALKTVQKENVSAEHDQAVYSTETANSVCSCLEAAFLHGLKSSAMSKLANYVGVGQQATAHSNLNFWTFVAKFTHGEVIAQLKHLGQITTEIGLCRAWVRVALNDCIMESYIDAMIADKKTLDYFYQRTAYLRDPEQPGIMKTYLQGLMNFEFKLSYNASVLNEWSYTPLVLAGIMDSKDAPPPVIKPVQRPSIPKPSSSSNVAVIDTDVEVTRMRSRSKTSIEGQPKKQSSYRHDNPMEQPRFGQPSENSYYVTSSEFTSLDVEEFKRISMKASSGPRSEYSDSSHMSCPDPAHMNVSPAAYVQKNYGKAVGTPSSDVSSLTEGQGFKTNSPSAQRKSDNLDSRSLNNQFNSSLQSNNNLDSNEFDSIRLDSDRKTVPIEIETFDYDADVEIEVKASNDESEAETKQSELEESWEEFYKSPVRKPQSEDTKFRKVQRLESITRDMREEAILNSIDVENGGNLVEKHLTSVSSNNDQQSSNMTFQDVQYEERIDPIVISDDNEIGRNVTERDGVDKGCIQEVRNVAEVTETEANVTYDATVNEPGISGGTSELLDLSQKLLNELGIEESENSINPVLAEESGQPVLNEESRYPVLAEERRDPVLIEEKVKIDSDDDDNEVKVSLSPRKRKKPKGKSAVDTLKPKLSLSPPSAEIVAPALSTATADKVDQVSVDKLDYLRKHRTSLPTSSLGVTSKEVSRSPRKSVPNILETTSEGDGMAKSPYSIEEYLYGTAPLEEEKDVHNGSPYKAPVKSLSPSSDITEESIQRGKSSSKSGEDIDTDEDLQRLGKLNKGPRHSIGNNLMLTGRGWSSSFDGEGEDSVDAMSPPRSSDGLNMPTQQRPKAESFGTLLQNYTPSSSLATRSIDDVLASLPESGPSLDEITSPQCSSPNEGEYVEGFEVVERSQNEDLNEASQMALFSEVANEKGLDAQNFQCMGCARAIGLIFGKPRTCKFDGGYYCYECHENDDYYIPALIVHNWDFRKHKVSKKNLAFLQENEDRPCINIEEANPRLYEHVPEMKEIQGLRMQLMYLKSYLFTCKQSIAEDLRRLVWPRDYLFENMELYSLADLLQVPGGGLASSLRKVIKFATKHVYGCRLCSQKGFICELCNSPKVIYAFEMEATYRCPQCKSVYHKECKTDNRPCPKCARRLARKSMSGTSNVVLTPDYDLRA